MGTLYRREIEKIVSHKYDFLDIISNDAADLHHILDLALVLKKERAEGHVRDTLKGKTLAMIFEKPSTRTRVSFEVAMRELGGDAMVLQKQDLQLGRGETVADTAQEPARLLMEKWGTETAYFADYRKMVRDEDLAAVLQMLRTTGWCGSSVTHPFKEMVVPLLDDVDPAAEAMGAVNTVAVREGRLCGFNTDYLGVAAALRLLQDLEHVVRALHLVLGQPHAVNALVLLVVLLQYELNRHSRK